VIGGLARFGGSASSRPPVPRAVPPGVVASASEAGAESLSAPETLGGEFGAVLASARAGESWAARTHLHGVLPRRRRSPLQGTTEPVDLASEVFVGVLRNLNGFEGDEARFRSWVFTIAHRRPSPTWVVRRARQRAPRRGRRPRRDRRWARRHAHARVELPVYACGAWVLLGAAAPASVGVWLPSRPRSRPPDWQRVPRSRFARASVACE
jgi:hypothetical protein